MAAVATPNPYGAPTEPDTLEIRRLLPGPIERSGPIDAPFSDGFSRLPREYDRRVPA